MASLYLSLTNAGLAAVQGASGSDPVTIASLGLTATPFTVAPTLTALPGEFKRIDAISGTAAAANITHMTAYDTSGDVWNATGLGLHLADGTLFAVYSAESTILNKAGPAFALVAFDIAFNADLAGSIAFGDPIFTNPPATTDTRGLVELATSAEAVTGTDVQRAITPAAGRAAVLAWLLAQDGSGSGLDADLLDGQNGSWYADIVARLGFTPLDVANYTAASVLSRLLTVDGSGSGLDADLLDGQNGSWYADIVARLGYTPLNATLLPAGMITLWSGSVASIPAGWHLCDGGGGTPDLRDRFVVGAGDAYAVGNTGGAATHNHAITIDAAATGITINTTTANVNGDGDPPAALLSATPNDPTHIHTASAANADSRPPYFALAYIMKL
ncbi:MAG: hypothetical protein C0409_02655 [Novosphingobium sp.]|nr:hypothetical protein [Novosphingobium sp.]